MAEHEHHERGAHNPHDGLVKRILTKAEAAAVELQHALAPALAAQLDWPSLRVEPGSVVDPNLAPRHTDVLYSIAWRGSERRLFVYVLMEHQSTVDPLMALRFLGYVTRIWERLVAERSEPMRTIPMIVPVLLYQGRTDWTAPRRLSELVEVPPDVAVPSPPVELEYVVDPLRECFVLDRIERDQLRDGLIDRALALVEAMRTLLWLAFHPEDIQSERAERLGMLLDIVRQRWGLDELRALFTYVISAFEPETPLQAILLQSASRETRQMFTSIRDHWIAEGQAEGMARMLEHLLDRRGLALSTAQRHLIAICDDPEQLQRWFDRALTATTTDEIFDA